MTTEQKIARRKLSLVELASDPGNVSDARRVMGYSRQQFYEIRRNFQTCWADGLIDRLPGAKGPQLNRVVTKIEQPVLDHALAHPYHGSVRVAQDIVLRGLQVSSGGVRGVWQRQSRSPRTTGCRAWRRPPRQQKSEPDDNRPSCRRIATNRGFDDMATKNQYEVFKLLFDQEDKRYTNLIDRGKTFISLATLYSGFITFTIEKLHNNTILSWALFSGAVGSMLIAFLLSILAIGIYRYEMINRPENIIQKFGDKPPADEEFFDDRIIDLTVACMRNGRRNDRRAKLLFWSSILMLLGLLLHGVYFLLRGLPLGGIV